MRVEIWYQRFEQPIRMREIETTSVLAAIAWVTENLSIRITDIVKLEVVQH